MCRNIRTLFNFAPPATEDEIRASALQFVRKLSGFTRPSKANETAFQRAIEEVSDAARRLLDSSSLPTAVIAFNDQCAVGLQDAFSRAGIDVPGQVSIVGYDNSMLAQLAHIDLTTVDQDAAQLAEHAVQVAADRLENGRTAPEEFVLMPRLVVRRTTGPVRSS